MQGLIPTVETIIALSTGLVVLAVGNDHLLRWTEVTPDVNWTYLPAGLRMCYALVLPIQGTLAIFLATMVLASRDPNLAFVLIVATACGAAAGPTLARLVAVQHLGLRPDLENLNSRMLWALSALFGLFSSTFHRAFFTARDRDPAWLSMWIGHTLGCLLCLYGLKGLTLWWRKWSRR